MKLLALGDVHARDTTPAQRLDDYVSTFKRKFEFCIDTAMDNDCDAILQPGDLVHSVRVSDEMKAWIIRAIDVFDKPFLTVLGQHDQRYHSADRRNTPSAVFEAAKSVHVLGAEPYELPGDHYPPTYFYGSSWNEEVPQPEAGIQSVLLLHRMIVDQKLWEAQQDHSFAKAFLVRNHYNLIVSGDNHKQFSVQVPHKWLFNAGSLMRSNIDQVDHEPAVWILDSFGDPRRIPVPCKPAAKVFDLSRAEAEKERTAELEEFVSTIQADVEESGNSFTDNLAAIAAKALESVRKRVDELVGEYHGWKHPTRAGCD